MVAKNGVKLQLSPDCRAMRQTVYKTFILPVDVSCSSPRVSTRTEEGMSAYRFDNFGDLYRAAFAENDPKLKQTLLEHVKTALDRWAESDRKRSNATAVAPKPARLAECTSIHRVA